MPETVLVTGASGYVGAWILNAFLDAGFNVRAQVRSKHSEEGVLKTHSKYKDQLSFTYVEDLITPGAFDEAVKGVDGVVHAASPFILDAKDYDKDLFEPALKGTLSVLQAVKKNAPNVKRIVITSSFADEVDTSKGLRPGYTYTENDWNPMTLEEAHHTDPSNAYLVSKVIAEHAAHDFVRDEKPNFTVTTLTPPMVYGPISHEVTAMDHLNTSAQDVYRLFNGSLEEVPDTAFWGYADVRDLGKAHLLAYTTEKAGGERYLICNASFSYQMFCNIIRKNFPELRDTTPEGKPDEPLPPVYKIDSGKSKRELGLTYRSMDESIVDMVNSLRELEKTLAK